MSTPPQSMNSNTPTPAYRNPNPARIARSTSSGVATPSSTRRTASFMRTTWRRDTMKPGASPQRTGVLPRCVRNVIVRSTTAADVAAPGTTSTSGMTWAGFNQCTTRNRSGPGTASARCLGEIVDDVEATIASSATRPVSRVKTSRLSSTDSGSASWTKPQLSTSARSVRSSMRSRAGATSADLMTSSSAMSRRSRAISRRASASAARASGRGLRSTRRARQPPSAQVSAIRRIAPILGIAPILRIVPILRIAPIDHHDVLPHSAVVVAEGDGGAGNLTGASLVAKLSEDLRGLGDAGGAERVPAADEAASRIDHDVATVIAASGRHERSGLALLAEAQLLVGDQLGDGEAVVDLGDVDIAGPDPGHPVGRFSRALERGPVSVILVERGELETVERLPRATNEDRLVGDRACPFLAGQDHGGGTVGDRRAHEQPQRARDHPRAEHLIERGALAEVGVGVPGRVIVVLDADEAELFLGRAIFRHVALGGQREARRRREAERGFPFAVNTGAHVEDGFGAFGLIQLLDAEHHHQVGEPGRDERVRVADADRPRRAHVLGASRQRRRLDAQRLGGQRRDVALERRALGHDGAHHQAFDVLRADAG